MTDLTGTYTGTIDFPERGLTGEATLVVIGNQYNLKIGSELFSGSITAVTTRGYTAVAIELGPTKADQTPMILSLRAYRDGNKFTLKSVPKEQREFSFSTNH